MFMFFVHVHAVYLKCDPRQEAGAPADRLLNHLCCLFLLCVLLCPCAFLSLLVRPLNSAFDLATTLNVDTPTAFPPQENRDGFILFRQEKIPPHMLFRRIWGDCSPIVNFTGLPSTPKGTQGRALLLHSFCGGPCKQERTGWHRP